MTIKLIVGLSNPGIEHSMTRHNAGSWYVHLLARRSQVILHEELKFHGFTFNINLFNLNIHLLIPTTFMNLSGRSVRAIMNFYHIQPEEILIAHDELDLPPGSAKFKYGGSHGGHNGLKDIIKMLDNNSNFYRLRIGIGHPSDKKGRKTSDFVLGKPSLIEKKLIEEAIDEAIICTDLWIKEGLTSAMNRLHTFKSNHPKM